MAFPVAIFKANDLRGKYPQEINENVASAVGLSFAQILRQIYKRPLKFVLGYDNRQSSPSLASAFLQGLIKKSSYFKKIQRIGLTTTPLFCFSLLKAKAEGGVMITASHNPFNENGFLLYLRGARSFLAGRKWDKKFQDLVKKNYSLLFRDKVKSKKKRNINSLVSSANFKQDYFSFLTSQIGIKRRLRFGIDDGGGTTRVFLNSLIKLFPQSLIKFTLVSGRKYRFSDPGSEKNTQDLAKLIRRRHLDGGVIFDSDGDRAVFLDEEGVKIHPDRIFALLANKLLKENKTKLKFVNTIFLNEEIKSWIEKKGGKIIISPVGYGFLHQQMKKEKAILGGEISGHYYYRVFNYRDDAFLTLIYILNILSESSKKFSQLTRRIPLNPSLFLSLPYENKREVQQLFKIARQISSELPSSKISFYIFDGYNWRTKFWRMNWRLSKTQNYLRIYWEQLIPNLS